MSTDFSCFVTEDNDINSLYLQVEGMRCASCAWRIESTLNALPDTQARINFSTQRLKISWKGEKTTANSLAAQVEALGFKVAPFSQASQHMQDREEEKFLLRCLAVSGFATGNIMLFSLALWFSTDGAMGDGTRTIMHWVMALIALPSVIYAGRPFFYSAWGVLKRFHTNMDVPISLAVILSCAMSLYETIRHGDYVYFDAAVMLLFFLLTGRYLDKKARGRARAAAEGLLAMLEGTATILEDGKSRSIIIRDIKPGMQLLVATGEKIAADGIVTQGTSEVDSSVVTGETIPRSANIGDMLYAGMVNLSAPIQMQVSTASDKSLLADIVSLMEKAEQGQANYVRLADRVASWYTPVVHALALGTLLGWVIIGQTHWQEALMAATAVLIITCPCALGLAVPVVQVLASSRLFKQGMLLKTGNALEQLVQVDTVIFDKTGTITLGKPHLSNPNALSKEALQLAASLASKSRHPLAQAVTAAYTDTLLPLDAQEIPAHGMEASYQGNTIRLGKRSWCGNDSAPNDDQLELWLNNGSAQYRLIFSDTLRDDTKATISQLKALGFHTLLLSGDRTTVTASIAQQAGIESFKGELTPIDKTQLVEQQIKTGHGVLMVGDGLNDAPALAAATVSMSPSTAVDISQNAADIVFRGNSLSPVIQAIIIARKTHRLIQENFALAMIYNVFAVPLAIFGFVTPLIAAVAMSSSSLLVIGNSFRLRK